MAKEPVAGRVKTRLARDVGAACAAAAHRTMLAAIAARLSNDRRWRTFLAVTPDTSAFRRGFPAGVPRIQQGGGDLGARLRRVCANAPNGPMVIVGSDGPAVAAADIADAFRALGNHDAVFGPAEDGGYYLVGVRRRPLRAGYFQNVRWSTSDALDDTVRSFGPARIAYLRRLSDVDDLAAYTAHRELIGRRVSPAR